MAFVLCETHGGHAAPLVCPHLADDVTHRRNISSSVRVDANYLNERAWSVYLCPDCATRYGINESTVLKSDDGLDRVFEFDQHPVCQLCFDELRGQHASDAI